MTDLSSERKIIKEKIGTITFYKYVIIFTLSAFGGTILQVATPAEDSQLRLLAEGFFFSGIVAFILSVINDIFLKKETAELAALDRRDMAEGFARELFTTHADTMVTEESFSRLMESQTRRKAIMRSLAGLITQEPDLKKTLERSYLEPIERPPNFRSVKATSTLKDYDEATGQYCWSCYQTMKTLRPIEHFRVFVCSDNDIAAKVEASTRATDFMILLSGDFDKDSAKDWLQNNMKLIVILREDNEVVELDTKMTFDMNELRNHPKCKEITDDQGVFCRITWVSKSSGLELDLRFERILSLKDDPFFYWDLQDYAFIDSIEIDYSKLLGHCGRTSYVPHIHNQGCRFDHDREKGLLRVRVNGLAGPGEGVVLIFRP